jgi:crossover junction endodeoxyribonuclease RuvC
VVQYTANEVKQAITGDGAADKKQVQHMVQRLLSLTTRPDPPDVADALALALCHLGQAGWQRKVKVKMS